jgi:subtilisin-like proprotein convertase family protein
MLLASAIISGAGEISIAQPTGACCMPRGGCQIYTQDFCIALNGTYNGDGTTCAGVTCPGACCTVSQGICVVVDALTCKRHGWVWKGGSCADSPCPAQQVAFNVPVAIPDSPAPNIPGQAALAQFTVPDTAAIANLRASVYLAHARQGDLRIILTHVSTGRSVTLVDRPGTGVTGTGGFTAPNFGIPPAPSGDDLIFGDDGATPYAAPYVPSPGIPGVTGTYRPLTPLSTFAGESAQGLWQLSVTDWNPGATGSIVSATLLLDLQRPPCYANCDGSTAAPVLDINDWICFLGRYLDGDPRANCDGSAASPALNVSDFICFIERYAAGCP